MRVIDRIDLVDRVARELQSRMRYAEIDSFLRGHGVDTKKPTSGANSKWVYSKELLDSENDAVILRIADELGVPHKYAVADAARTVEATFWEPLHFKLFLSHLATFKKTTGLLQKALRGYGISAFVAHVDIEPTKEWQNEIEAGLLTMDALAAILMPGFKESNWTDQEVGVAVGRGVLVVPIIRGLNPYGFISKYQGMHASGKTVAEVAHELFTIIVKSSRTRSRMLSALVETTLRSVTEADALEKIGHLSKVKEVPAAYLQQLRDGAASSAVLSKGKPLANLDELLVANKLEPVAKRKKVVDFDDDIPF